MQMVGIDPVDETLSVSRGVIHLRYDREIHCWSWCVHNALDPLHPLPDRWPATFTCMCMGCTIKTDGYASTFGDAIQDANAALIRWMDGIE